MSGAAFPHRKPLPSDAPLASDLVGLSGGHAGLRRWLDPVYVDDARVREAFTGEIRALVRIPQNSVYLVPLVNAEDIGDPWLVREYAEEGTLEDRLREGPPLTGGELLTVAEAVLGALDELTRLNLTHGDPSPRNMLLTKSAGVRLADAASSRRAFARRLEPETEPGAADRERFAAWLGRAASAYASDAVCRELCGALAAGSADVALFAVRRLVDQRKSWARPIGRSSPGLAPATPLEPVPVFVSLGPVSDPRLAYQTARAVSDLTREPLADIRRTLESTTAVFPSTMPDAQRLIDECARLRVRIEVRAADDAEGGRP